VSIGRSPVWGSTTYPASARRPGILPRSFRAEVQLLHGRRV